jgi:hypothetical protein
MTCGSCVPVVTAPARWTPVVPDAVRTEHGPAPLYDSRVCPGPVAHPLGARGFATGNGSGTARPIRTVLQVAGPRSRRRSLGTRGTAHLDSPA